MIATPLKLDALNAKMLKRKDPLMATLFATLGYVSQTCVILSGVKHTDIVMDIPNSHIPNILHYLYPQRIPLSYIIL